MIDTLHRMNPLPSDSIGINQHSDGTMYFVKSSQTVQSNMLNHFRQRVNSNTSVVINCGRWSNSTASILCDKGETGTVTGTSENYEDTFEVTGISAAGWIVALRDEGAGTVTPTFVSSYPSVSEIGVTHFPLCRLAWDSSYSCIEKLEPIWYGGDIVTAGSSIEHHFRVDQISTTSLTVHAGRVQIGTTSLKLSIDGGGTSGDFTDIKTVSSITTTGWCCIELDSRTTPTTATIVMKAAYPEMDDRWWPLANVTCSGGVIVSIEQCWTGGDIDWPDVGSSDPLDELSVNLNDDTPAEVQIYNWKAAASADPDDSDFVVFKHISDSKVLYANRTAFTTWLVDGTDFTGWFTTHFPYDGRYWVLGGNASNCYGYSIGNPSATTVIDLENRTLLYNGGGGGDNYAILDWANDKLYSVYGLRYLSLDWSARQLHKSETGGTSQKTLDWSSRELFADGGLSTANWGTKELLAGSPAAATLKWGDKDLVGDWETTGKHTATEYNIPSCNTVLKKESLVLTDSGHLNYWDKTELIADVTSLSLKTSISDIKLNPAQNLVMTVGSTNYTGVTISNVSTKGILTGSTLQEYTIKTLDGSGNPITIKVLGRP
jgi:hypothetical protein